MNQNIENLEKHPIEDKRKILEIQKETVESFKQYFGTYEVVFETAEEAEKKFNAFFQWKNQEWIVPGKGKPPEQLWKEAGNPPIELQKIKLKDSLPKNANKIGIIADPIFGIVIVPFYGYLKEFFEGNYKKIPDHMGFFYEVIVESDKVIPSFIVRDIILKNKARAIEIFKEGYEDVNDLDDVFNILKKHREDWNDSPGTWQEVADFKTAGTKKQEKKDSKEHLEEERISMEEFELAWKEFFKNKPKPKTDEEDRKQQEEFHYWYNNIRKQNDTGKTPVEMGKRIMNFEWDEDYTEDFDELEECRYPIEAEHRKVSLIRKILLITDLSFPNEWEKAVEKFKEEKKKEIEVMRSAKDFNRGAEAWFLLEYRLPNGKTPMECVFSRDDLDKLFNKREIKMIENFLTNIRSLFAIKKVLRNNKDYLIENVLDNKQYIIKTIDLQAKLKIGNFIDATIVQNSQKNYFFYGNIVTYSKKEGQKMKNFILEEIKK